MRFAFWFTFVLSFTVACFASDTYLLLFKFSFFDLFGDILWVFWPVQQIFYQTNKFRMFYDHCQPSAIIFSRRSKLSHVMKQNSKKIVIVNTVTDAPSHIWIRWIFRELDQWVQINNNCRFLIWFSFHHLLFNNLEDLFIIKSIILKEQFWIKKEHVVSRLFFEEFN